MIVMKNQSLSVAQGKKVIQLSTRRPYIKSILKKRAFLLADVKWEIRKTTNWKYIDFIKRVDEVEGKATNSDLRYSKNRFQD